VLVDINYPTTIIFSNNTQAWYNGNWSDLNQEPWFMDNFYLYNESDTYILYKN
jgi:hypothetical protein